MKRAVFDIEADGLLDTVTKIHCLEIEDCGTKETFSFGPNNINQGIELLKTYDRHYAHNNLWYDSLVLRKFYPQFDWLSTCWDTLLMAQLRWIEIIRFDIANRYHIPKDLYGSYSLEAFGYRLGVHKGSFKGPWDTWTQEMQNYCKQDVKVARRLLRELDYAINDNIITHDVLDLERKFARLMVQQHLKGVPFNVDQALRLKEPITVRRDSLLQEIQTVIPPKVIQLKTKQKIEPFNPNSPQQILKYLQDKYSWEPTSFTDKGNAEMGDSVLEGINYPEIQLIREYKDNNKLLSMLSEGDKSWLQYVKNGRLHGEISTAGAVTGRCTHSSPNLAQVPSVDSFMGAEVRSLFYAPEGYNMVGVDASSLELRCLAHYLWDYDYGKYADFVVNGDVHEVNRASAGLPTRALAKRFIYALNYGAGDEELGSIASDGLTPAQQKNLGNDLRRRFMANTTGFGRMMNDIKTKLRDRGYLIGIDGRRLYIRKQHAALNTLLQNAGAVAMKLAVVKFWDKMHGFGYPALQVHDEFQSMIIESKGQEAGIQGVLAIESAGQDLRFKCPLTGAYKIGKNWSETH